MHAVFKNINHLSMHFRVWPQACSDSFQLTYLVLDMFLQCVNANAFGAQDGFAAGLDPGFPPSIRECGVT